MATKKEATKKNPAKGKMEDVKKTAEKEITKIKKEMDKSAKKVESYIKKNPEKATLISAGVGAALGAAVAMLMKGKKKK